MKKVDLFGKSELLKGLQKQLEKTENLLEIQKTENENIQKSYLQLSCKSNEYETEIDNYEVTLQNKSTPVIIILYYRNK